MKSIFKHVLVSIGVAWVLLQLESLAGSSVIIPFLKANLITIILSLLAINSATLAIVLTKLRDLLGKDASSGEFDNTKREMRFSIYEQVALVFVAVILMILIDSTWGKANPNFISICSHLLVSSFVYSIIVLVDTARSVFIVLEK